MTDQPSPSVAPEAGPRVALAADIGGTKIATAIVDEAGGVTCRQQAPTPRDPDPEALWAELSALLAATADGLAAEGGREPVGIGVGCGGPMLWPAGVVSPLNIPAWRGFPLRERLGTHADRWCAGGPVRVHNDAICVVIAEHWCGVGRGWDHVLGMVASTGVGGGIIAGGRLVDGAGGNAGHIGHVCVDPHGPRCACGARGCLEAVASGPNTAAWAAAQGWHNPAGSDAATLSADARRGHPVACAALRRAGRALGVGIAAAAHLVDLDLVSVGGGLTGAGALLFDPLRAAFADHAGLDFARATRIVAASAGQDAGLVGAAALVLGGEAYWSAG